MLKFNLLNVNKLMIKQSRNLRRFKVREKKVKKFNLVNIGCDLNRRFKRTKVDLALLNRIYFRYEMMRLIEGNMYNKIENELVRHARLESFKKSHNLAILGEEALDRVITYHIKRQRYNHQMFSRTKEHDKFFELIKQNSRLPANSSENLNNQINENPNEKSNNFFDQNGCLIYGKTDCNSFILDGIKISPKSFLLDHKVKRNFYRLLDSKLNEPKLYLDFYPCIIGSMQFIHKAFNQLNYAIKTNLIETKPFNIYFTNFINQFDELIDSVILKDMNKLPNFIDFKNDQADVRFSKEKLIIVTRNGVKPLYYDPKANYLIPVYVNNDTINMRSQGYYSKEFAYRPNVEFVCYPDNLVDGEIEFNVLFYFLLLKNLKQGLNLTDSLTKTYYHSNKFNFVFNKHYEWKKQVRNEAFYLEKQKKYRFKYFDNIESELM